MLAPDEPYREAILDRFFHELSPTEIARRRGVPLETVRTRQKRALRMLRARMERHRRDWRAGVVALFAWPRRRPVPIAAVLVVAVGATAAAVLMPGAGSAARSGARGPAVVALDRGSSNLPRGSQAPEGDATLADATLAQGVSGLVVTPLGAPIAGATVELISRGMEVVQRVFSDGAGRFGLSAGEDEQVTLVVRCDGHGSARIRKLQAPAEVRIVLLPAKELRVQVLDAGDRPVAGAEVACSTHQLVVPGSVADQGELLTQVSDADGRLRFAALGGLGPVSLHLRHGEYRQQGECWAEITDAPVAEATLRASAGRTLYGEIVDEADRPIAGARVGCDPWFRGASVSDAAGRFEIGAVTEGAEVGEYVWAKAVGFAAARARPPPSGELRIRLDRGKSAEGRLLWAEGGEPLGGATLVAVGVGGGALLDDTEEVEATTDAGGHFTLTALRSECRHALFWQRGERRILVADLPELPAGHRNLGDVRVAPSVDLRVRVRYESGDPVPGIRVEVSVPRPEGRAAFRGAEIPASVIRGFHEVFHADRNGCVRLPSMSPGTYLIRVLDGERERRITLPGAQSECVITLPGSRLFRVYVTGDRDAVASACDVRVITDTRVVRRAGRRFGVVTVPLSAEERVTQVELRSFALPSVPPLLLIGVPPQQDWIRFQLGGETILRGQVLDPAGSPQPGARIQVLREGEAVVSCVANDEGRFELHSRGLEACTLDLRWEGTVLQGGKETVRNAHAELRSVRANADGIVLRAQAQASGTLEARVVDEDGHPVCGATVIVVPPFAPKATTDERGRVCFRELPLRPVTLLAAERNLGTGELVGAIPGEECVEIRLRAQDRSR